MTGIAILVLGLLCAGGAAAVIVVLVLAVVNGQKRARERTDGLAGFARVREWSFAPDGTGLEQRFSGAPFGRGHARAVRNVVEGTFEARRFVAFDYTFTTGSGDDAHHHRFSVVAMRLDVVSPMLAVAPQGAFGRFFSDLFNLDVPVGDPAFDAAFAVRADSVEFARDVLHPGLRAWLATYQDRAWRLQGDQLLMFRSGAHTPQEIDAVLASMKAILDQVPPHVWARLGGLR